MYLKSTLAGLLCLSAYFELRLARWLCKDAYNDMSDRLMKEYLEDE